MFYTVQTEALQNKIFNIFCPRMPLLRSYAGRESGLCGAAFHQRCKCSASFLHPEDVYCYLDTSDLYCENNEVFLLQNDGSACDCDLFYIL